MPKLLTDTAAAWRCPPAVRHAEWIPRHVYVPRQGQSPIRFDLDTYPHAAGVLNCFDDPNVREIYLPWAAQGLGKTTICVALIVSIAANMPRPMVAARENQENTETKLFAEQIVPTLEACLATRNLLPPPARRRKESIDLTHCRVRRAFSGAPGTLSGYPAAVAVGSEVSKWSKNETGEADPWELMLARLVNYPFDSKAIGESTPAMLGSCRITKLARRSGVLILKRFCPCPHCGTYQLLLFGKPGDGPGLKWDKLPTGRSDPQLSEETAYYRCLKGCRIESEDRHALLRNGVWLADNQSIGKARVRKGEITRPGRIKGKTPAASKIAFGDPVDAPFGAMHSLAISGWGWIAREFFDRSWQHFLNAVLGGAYDPTPKATTPNELAERLKSATPRGQVPAGSFLTLAADTGVSGESLHFWWMLCAWNALLKRGHVVDWGLAETIAALDAVAAQFHPVRVGIDAGGNKVDETTSVSDRVYEITKARGRHWWPVRGSKHDLGPDWYVEGFQRSGLKRHEVRKKRRHGLGDLLWVNSPLTQDARESLVYGRTKPDDAGFITLPAEVAAMPERFSGLLNQLAADYRDGSRWLSRGANEYGDTLRYNRVLAEHALLGGTLWGQDVHLQDAGSTPAATRTEGWFAQQKRRR